MSNEQILFNIFFNLKTKKKQLSYNLPCPARKKIKVYESHWFFELFLYFYFENIKKTIKRMHNSKKYSTLCAICAKYIIEKKEKKRKIPTMFQFSARKKKSVRIQINYQLKSLTKDDLAFFNTVSFTFLV